MCIKKLVLPLLMVVLAMFVQARTIALWPLETTSSGYLDGRCAIDANNDLTAWNFTNLVVKQNWNLPPNPDTSLCAFPPLSYSAVHAYPYDKNNNGFLRNPKLGVMVARDKDWTLEGYINFLELPKIGSWICVMGCADENDHTLNRWTLSLRRLSDDNGCISWIVWADGGWDHKFKLYPSEADSYAITNQWLHIALTHTKLVGGVDNWAFFINGVQQDSTFHYNATTVSKITFANLDLGGRHSMSNGGNLALDYWRLSDKVLTPAQFLCGNEGKEGTVYSSKTVSYWPLGSREDGILDTRDAVGEANFNDGFDDTPFAKSRITSSRDCAFETTPPNSSVTLPNGNVGCIQGGSSTASWLQQPKVGVLLNLSTSFTVEGWFAPRLAGWTTKDANKTFDCHLFGTRPNYESGWSFQFNRNGANSAYFTLWCNDGKGTRVDNHIMSGSLNLSDWYETWKHVALVYDAQGGSHGYGEWSLYLDGKLLESVENNATANVISSPGAFILGGRSTIAEKSFEGKIDCARVCQAALLPEQFMCTKGGVAANSVVALWPLNVGETGSTFDLQDVSGNDYHFRKTNASQSIQIVRLCADNSNLTITNPDTSYTLRAKADGGEGCARFCDPNNGNCHQSCLCTGNSVTMAAMAGNANFTLECYYRRCVDDIGGSQEVVFYALDASRNPRMRIFRKNDGIYIWENYSASKILADTKIPNTADSDLLKGVWYHLAFIHTIENIDGVNTVVWRCYVNGEYKGMAQVTVPLSNPNTLTTFMVGGRYGRDNNSVIGDLAHIRLSNAGLTTDEFLCATGVEVKNAKTSVAYWPLEQDGTNKLNAEYPLELKGTGSFVTPGARVSIPNLNVLTNEVKGSERRNKSAYTLSEDGWLACAGLGYELAFSRPFTIEGWLKWQPITDTQQEDLVVAGNDTAGLRLYFDKQGDASKLHIWARDMWPATPHIDGEFTFDFSQVVGKWVHIAVVSNPYEGDGTWHLYVDGKSVGGVVRNFYRAHSLMYFNTETLKIGSDTRPLGGTVDMLRLVSGVCVADELLYAYPQGVTIFLR